MLSALRRRLALLFVLLTLPVLTVALGAGAWLYHRQQREAADTLFIHTAQNLCDSLTEAASVKDSWLAQRQQAAGGILDPAAVPAASAGLDAARTGEDGSALYQFVTFTLTDDTGTSWRGAAAVLPRGGTDRLELMLLQPAGLAFGVGPAVFLAALWLAGTGLLTGAGWLLAGVAAGTPSSAMLSTSARWVLSPVQTSPGRSPGR